MSGTRLPNADSLSRRGGREVNEDRVGGWTSDRVACWIVADGLGGHGAGEVAAQTAVDTALATFRERPEVSPRTVARCLEAAHAGIMERKRLEPGLAAMRTTAAVLVCDREFAVWGHVGDTRVYHLRDGAVAARTRDHSVAQALVDAGEIAANGLRTERSRNTLLRALGDERNHSPESVPLPVPLQVGDAFLICSDGLWEYVADLEIVADLAKSRTSGEWLAHLESRILLQGHGREHDNYSAIAVFVGEPSTCRRASGSVRNLGTFLGERWRVAGVALAYVIAGLVIADRVPPPGGMTEPREMSEVGPPEPGKPPSGGSEAANVESPEPIPPPRQPDQRTQVETAEPRIPGVPEKENVEPAAPAGPEPAEREARPPAGGEEGADARAPSPTNLPDPSVPEGPQPGPPPERTDQAEPADLGIQRVPGAANDDASDVASIPPAGSETGTPPQTPDRTTSIAPIGETATVRIKLAPCKTKSTQTALIGDPMLLIESDDGRSITWEGGSPSTDASFDLRENESLRWRMAVTALRERTQDEDTAWKVELRGPDETLFEKWDIPVSGSDIGRPVVGDQLRTMPGIWELRLFRGAAEAGRVCFQVIQPVSLDGVQR